MTKRFRQVVSHSPLTSLITALSIVSCSGEDPASTPEGPTAVESSALESARISKYLDEQYKRSDVRHGFRTRFDEEIDCVDADAQPGLRGSGLHYDDTLVPPPSLSPPDSTIVPVIDDSTDPQGNRRACPPRTVPILRLNASRILRSGGLDHFLERAGRKQISSATSGALPPMMNGFSYASGVNEILPAGTAKAFKSTLAVYDPRIQGGSDHSISQLWGVTPGGNYPCSPSCVQTLEVGWNVDEALYQDGADDGGAAHLFTFATNDGYARSGCYNLITNCAGQAGTSHGSGLVMLANARYTPGQVLANGVVGGTPVELTVQWTAGGAAIPYWYLYVNGNAIGYIPFSFFSNGQGSGAPLSTGYVYRLKAGGEVYDPTQHSSMGSGQVASKGYKKAAYQRNVTYYKDTFDGSGDLIAVNAPITITQADSPYYTASATPAAGASGWGSYFYFGGPGKP